MTLFGVATNQLRNAAQEYLCGLYLHVGLLPGQRDVEDIQKLLQVLVEKTCRWVSVMACTAFPSHVLECLKTLRKLQSVTTADILAWQKKKNQFAATEKQAEGEEEAAIIQYLLPPGTNIKKQTKKKTYKFSFSRVKMTGRLAKLQDIDIDFVA